MNAKTIINPNIKEALFGGSPKLSLLNIDNLGRPGYYDSKKGVLARYLQMRHSDSLVSLCDAGTILSKKFDSLVIDEGTIFRVSELVRK